MAGHHIVQETFLHLTNVRNAILQYIGFVNGMQRSKMDGINLLQRNFFVLLAIQVLFMPFLKSVSLTQANHVHLILPLVVTYSPSKEEPQRKEVQEVPQAVLHV